MYTTVNIPVGGYKPDADLELLLALDYAIGQRGERHTTVHIRGLVHAGRESVPFAGEVYLTEGRDSVSHDLQLYGHKLKKSARAEITEGLALTVVQALSEYTDVVAAEARRLAGAD